MNTNRNLTILILLTCITINGCRVASENPTQPPNGLPQATTLPTLTTLPNTPLPTPFQTITLAPTLLPAEAEAKILELLRNNGGCLLPCFWGFTPIQNTGEFLSFLMRTGIDDGSFIVMRDNLILEIQTALAGDSKAIYTQAYHKSTYEVEKTYGSSYYNEYFQYYSLHSLLTTYGPPEEVYIVLDTGIADMGLGIDLYLLSIEYPKDGWMAVFEMPLQQKEDTFLGCPSEAFVNLRLWSPDNKPSGAFLGGFGGDDKSYLFTIEEATGMTLEQFYQKFKDQANTACLETPINIQK